MAVPALPVVESALFMHFVNLVSPISSISHLIMFCRRLRAGRRRALQPVDCSSSYLSDASHTIFISTGGVAQYSTASIEPTSWSNKDPH